jgi:hypothetical protein
MRRTKGVFVARRIVSSLVLLAALFASQRADAQTSFTSSAFYDTSVLESGDWKALHKDYLSQSLRGSMALVFADRPPITDPREVEKWIKEKPLAGFSFPGLNADPVGSWALAKKFAISNHKAGEASKPVVAVNTGWTDWMFMFGHFYELGSIRPAVEAGRSFRGDPISMRVARLIKERTLHLQRQGKPIEPLLLGSHSAGGFYTANISWRLHETNATSALSSLRVQSIGLATHLPKTVKARRLVGSNDMVAQVNSHGDSLVAKGTKVEGFLSHNGGPEWSFADSLSVKPWRVESMQEAFDGLRQGKNPRSLKGKSAKARIDFFKTRAAEHKKSAEAAKALARSHFALHGVRRLVYLKLDHEAEVLALDAERDSAIADFLAAKIDNESFAKKSARRTLRGLHEKRRTLDRRLQSNRDGARLTRNMGVDTMDFMAHMALETATSMTPPKLMGKTTQATLMWMKVATSWTGMMLNNPLFNPLAGAAEALDHRTRSQNTRPAEPQPVAQRIRANPRLNRRPPPNARTPAKR